MPSNPLVSNLSSDSCGIPHDVHVLRVNFDFESSLDDQIFDILSPEERNRALRFVKHNDAIRFAVTRVILRRCISDVLGKAANALQFTQSAFGRPILCGVEAVRNLDFNVSHSGNHGLVAWSTARRIGVDIEVQNSQLSWCQLVETVFGEADIRELQATPPMRRGELFFDIWVAKEALLKAHGTGIAESLKDFSVMLCGSSPSVTGHTILAEILRRFQGVWLRDIIGYAAFIAWSREQFTA